MARRDHYKKMALIPNLSLLFIVSAALKPSIFLKPVKLVINFRIMSYTLYQGTRIGLALKEALDEMEVGTLSERDSALEKQFGVLGFYHWLKFPSFFMIC